jgi:hypothetical protein
MNGKTGQVVAAVARPWASQLEGGCLAVAVSGQAAHALVPRINLSLVSESEGMSDLLAAQTLMPAAACAGGLSTPLVRTKAVDDDGVIVLDSSDDEGAAASSVALSVAMPAALSALPRHGCRDNDTDPETTKLKKGPNAFICFLRTACAELMQLTPGLIRKDAVAQASKRWNQMEDTAKAPYIADSKRQTEELKEKHRATMLARRSSDVPTGALPSNCESPGCNLPTKLDSDIGPTHLEQTRASAAATADQGKVRLSAFFAAYELQSYALDFEEAGYVWTTNLPNSEHELLSHCGPLLAKMRLPEQKRLTRLVVNRKHLPACNV